MHVIVVGLTTTSEVHGAPPNVTDVAPVKFEPVMVTAVPPAGGPAAGTIDVITGMVTTSVMVRVACDGVPRTAPPVGLLSCRITVSGPSGIASGIGVTVNVLFVPSPLPQVSVPLVTR
jgi:hypothetical protein